MANTVVPASAVSSLNLQGATVYQIDQRRDRINTIITVLRYLRRSSTAVSFLQFDFCFITTVTQNAQFQKINQKIPSFNCTLAGWAADAERLEPCGCCHLTPPPLPSLSSDSAKTRWPQRPPSPLCTDLHAQRVTHTCLAYRSHTHTQPYYLMQTSPSWLSLACNCHINESVLV